MMHEFPDHWSAHVGAEPGARFGRGERWGLDTCISQHSLEAVDDFVPRSEALGTPEMAGFMQPIHPLVGHC